MKEESDPRAGPVVTDIPYGSHPRQRLDLFRPEGSRTVPLFIWFHGGGYVGGDKANLPVPLRERLIEKGIAVASVNYRFSDDLEFLAPLRDAANAILFLDRHADHWRLMPGAVAYGGLSAGGLTACWLVYGKPDVKVPRSRCLALSGTQTTADPRAIRALLGGSAWRIESLQKLFRLVPDQYDEPANADWLETFDFPARVSRFSPPVFLLYATPWVPLHPDLSLSTAIHHPAFGAALKARLDAVGVDNVLRVREETANPDEWYPAVWREMADFMARHLVKTTSD